MSYDLNIGASAPFLPQTKALFGYARKLKSAMHRDEMKNLATSIWAVMALTVGSVNTVFSNDPSEDTSWIKRGKTMDWRGKEASKQPAAQAGRLLRNNSHVFAYVPADIRSAGEPSLRCDQGGIRTESISGYCIDYNSDGERTSWKIRYESAGRIDRVFKYAGYKNRYSALDLWVVFDTSPSSPINSVLFVSPTAKQKFSQQSGNPEFPP